MPTVSAFFAVLGRFLLTALNPRLGTLAKPFAATYHSMGRMLVEVFGGLRLIERSHPWRRPHARVPILDLLTLAWARTDWRKPWAPIPVFVASTSALLVFGLLAFTSALVAGGIGATHAYAGSLFSSPNPSTDLALNYMRDAFGVKITGTAAATPDALVQGFQQMMGLYSMAMLVVAGFILLYIILSSVAATAHEGRFGGSNFNQVWAPIRLVVAIGLLVPLPMGSYAGYNSGQYIVLVLAQWGSAVASNLWTNFAASLVKQQDVLAVSTPEPAANIVRGVLIAEFCKERYNAIKPASEPPVRVIDDPNFGGRTVHYIFYQTSNTTTTGFCGTTSYEVPNPEGAGITVFVKDVQASYRRAYDVMRSSAEQLARKLAQEDYISGENALPGVGGPVEEAIIRALIMEDNNFNQIVTTYQDSLAKALKSAQNLHKKDAPAAMTSETKQSGWAGAAIWFNTIARLNAEFMYAARSLPNTTLPKLETAAKEAKAMPERLLVGKVQEGINVLDRYLDGIAGKMQDYTGGSLTGFSVGDSTKLATESVVAGFGSAANGVDTKLDWTKVWDKQARNSSADIGKTLNMFFDTRIGGPFQSTGRGLDMKLDEVYPLAQLAAIGDWMVSRSFVLLGSNAIVGSNFLSMIGIAGAGAGLVLLYVLPLMPFIRFLFAVVGWLLNILEALIAIPLVAVAHLTTGGGGLSGDLARTAYFMIFSLFLRPALLIVGMIVALMMFSVSVHVLNSMYSYAVVGATGGGDGTSNGGLSTIMYTILYTVIAYMLCNLCFTLIESIPNHALTWIGRNAEKEITQDESVKSAISNAGDRIVFTPMQHLRIKP